MGSRRTPLPGKNFHYKAVHANGKRPHPLAYKELNLNAPWKSFDLRHGLTDKGVKQFVDGYLGTLKSAA